MLDDRNKYIFPHENLEEKIKDCFRETEQDIRAYRIMHAYYGLQKTNKMIVGLADSSAQKIQLKQQQKELNNKLNNEIIKFIEKYNKQQ